MLNSGSEQTFSALFHRVKPQMNLPTKIFFKKVSILLNQVFEIEKMMQLAFIIHTNDKKSGKNFIFNVYFLKAKQTLQYV